MVRASCIRDTPLYRHSLTNTYVMLIDAWVYSGIATTCYNRCIALQRLAYMSPSTSGENIY